MSLEITAEGLFYYSDASGMAFRIPVSKQTTPAALKPFWHKQTIGFAAEEAIKLGEETSLGWAIFINRDATNFITLRVSTGGAAFAKLVANGGFAILYLGSGAQVPYAIADTAACLMEYAIIPQ